MPAEPVPAPLARFLHGETDAGAFRHADHVRVAFELLIRHGFAEAAARCSEGLKRMAAKAGAPGAYHETITIAFLAVIGERIATGSFAGFEDFAEANPDLFDKRVLERWYGAERLASPLARATFVLP